MKGKYLISCLLVAVVISSGCTTTNTTVETGNGVIIEDYDVEFSNVYSGECVDLGILIRNIGSVDSENVFVEMLGIEQDWYDGKAWGEGCLSEDGGHWSGWEKTTNEAECMWNPGAVNFGLLAPDVDRGTSGESKSCTWSYMAPEIPYQSDVTYPITLRVFYQYRTDVAKVITLMTKDEMNELIKQSRTIPIDPQSSTRSPVELDIKTATPLRIYRERVEFPVEININNVGGGFTCVGYDSWDDIKDCRSSQQSQKKSAWRKVVITVEADSPLKLSDECNDEIELTLYKGKSNTITCTATVDIDDLSSSRVQTLIRAHAYYNYIIDQDIELIVHGGIN
jgi:hypothetical protein